MLISLTVGKVDAGVAVLLTHDKRLIEFPSILLPPNIASGSIVDINVARNIDSESRSQDTFSALQDQIYNSFGSEEPSPPVLRCRNATQTSVVLEWDPISLSTADIISLSLFRNGQKAGNIPRPLVMQSTKISGLAVDTEYVFHLVLRTTAGMFASERVTVRTHKMTDLSGITVTPGILPAQLRDSLCTAIERIGARLADTVRIDTTHFVTTEGRGPAWEKAVEMNIPVVRPEWVEGCERGGRVVGVRGYYLDADPKQRQVISQAMPQATNGNARGHARGESLNGAGSEGAGRDRNGSVGSTPPQPPAKDPPRAASQAEAVPEQREEPDNQRDEDDDARDTTSPRPDSASSGQEAERKRISMRPVKATQDSPPPSASGSEQRTRPVGLGLEVPETPENKDGIASGESTPGGFQEVAL